MSRLTVRLPSTLHHQLRRLASNEGVSLNQYIVYALTRQSAQAYTVHEVPEEEVMRQRASFDRFLESLGEASEEEVAQFLAEREVVEPDSAFEREMVAQLQADMKENHR